MFKDEKNYILTTVTWFQANAEEADNPGDLPAAAGGGENKRGQISQVSSYNLLVISQQDLTALPPPYIFYCILPSIG